MSLILLDVIMKKVFKINTAERKHYEPFPVKSHKDNIYENHRSFLFSLNPDMFWFFHVAFSIDIKCAI